MNTTKKHIVRGLSVMLGTIMLSIAVSMSAIAFADSVGDETVGLRNVDEIVSVSAKPSEFESIVSTADKLQVVREAKSIENTKRDEVDAVVEEERRVEELKSHGVYFKGHHFDLGGVVAGGAPTPHDGRVYQHASHHDIFLFEAVVEAGRAVEELQLGDQVWIDGVEYVVTDKISRYFQTSSDGRDLVYWPNEHGKMNGWSYDVFFQTCTEMYWPCPIDIWLLDRV